MPDDLPKPRTDVQTTEVSVAPVEAHCLRCDRDHSQLPEAARYCPKCGLDVLGSPPGTIVSHVAGQDSRISGLLGGWEHLFRIFEPSAPSDAPAKPGDSTSMMVKGYGNALYRLGRRYEFGRGAMANPREALRCYSKSARLGNFWAMARLASDIFVRKSGTAPTNDGSPIVSDGATGADVPRAASGDPPSDAPAAH